MTGSKCKCEAADAVEALDPGVPYESRWAPYVRIHGPGQGQFPKGSIRPRGYMAPDARRSLAGANVATLTPHRQRPEGCNPRLCTARWQDRSPHERSDMRGPAPAGSPHERSDMRGPAPAPDVASLIRATFPALAPGTRACSRFGFQTAASSSLRANGSRERAPDDRL